MKIKTGMVVRRKSDGKKGRIGELFDRDRWDESYDPEWYVQFEGFTLKILPESVIRSTLVVED